MYLSVVLTQVCFSVVIVNHITMNKICKELDLLVNRNNTNQNAYVVLKN